MMTQKNQMIRWGAMGLWLLAFSAWARTNEFRAFSVDAWGRDFNTSAKCTAIIDNLRRGNLNAVFMQVRRRGDAFYNSRFEPKNPEIPGNFDPLADLIAKAHDTSGGKQKIEIHAWIVTYHVCKGEPSPSQTNHPVNLHRDWLLQDIKGKTFIDRQYTFDPGHPDVQRHTFNVCMDIITNYDVDGLNFDYVRYSGLTEGYNPVSVARFNQRFGRTGQPAPTDPAWMQFRRDQITALVRKIYLCAATAKPNVKISADTITWHPGVTTLTDWTNRAKAYTTVLQDWRAWMEEGILDFNMPMNYFREANPTNALDYRNWSDFATNHKYNRHAVINAGTYLNSVSHGLAQMRYARQTTAAGHQPDGVASYDYRTTNKDRVATANFIEALAASSCYETNDAPLFAQPAEMPDMPWKTKPTKGHLKGFISGRTLTNYLDGAAMSLAGPVKRSFISDATGFFGSVDLPPGQYTLQAAWPGCRAVTTNFTVTAGMVTTQDLLLSSTLPTATKP